MFTPSTMVDHANLLATIETDFRQCHTKYWRGDCEKENKFTTIYQSVE